MGGGGLRGFQENLTVVTSAHRGLTVTQALILPLDQVSERLPQCLQEDMLVSFLAHASLHPDLRELRSYAVGVCFFQGSS